MDNIVSLPKLKLGKEENLSLNSSTPWLMSILHELSSDTSSRDSKEQDGLTFDINFNGELIREKDHSLGDIVKLLGALSVTYITQCAQSGELMNDKLNLDVQAVFIDNILSNKYEDDENMTLFIGNMEYELYFYENSKLDLAQVLHEYISLNKNPYPKKV
ncbi:MAG: hypothetical protein HOJ35_03050 [Bdellovibrionales bacterium]|nr:hypothetical protein [Bdellovibrionales bacterium]